VSLISQRRRVSIYLSVPSSLYLHISHNVFRRCSPHLCGSREDASDAVAHHRRGGFAYYIQRTFSYVEDQVIHLSYDVFTGVKRKTKVALFVEHLLTGEYSAHDISQSHQNTNVSSQLEHLESTTQQSPEHTKDRRPQRQQHPKTLLNSAKHFCLETQPSTAGCAPHHRSRLVSLDGHSAASSRQPAALSCRCA
jgi:hypothetical protein